VRAFDCRYASADGKRNLSAERSLRTAFTHGELVMFRARGLTAYDAAHVALAEAEGIRLLTDEDLITAAAGEVTTGLDEA
jgi:predicted nucleic acid-binding protein